MLLSSPKYLQNYVSPISNYESELSTSCEKRFLLAKGSRQQSGGTSVYVSTTQLLSVFCDILTFKLHEDFSLE